MFTTSCFDDRLPQPLAVLAPQDKKSLPISYRDPSFTKRGTTLVKNWRLCNIKGSRTLPRTYTASWSVDSLISRTPIDVGAQPQASGAAGIPPAQADTDHDPIRMDSTDTRPMATLRAPNLEVHQGQAGEGILLGRREVDSHRGRDPWVVYPHRLDPLQGLASTEILSLRMLRTRNPSRPIPLCLTRVH